jgi:hypothetical protein
LQDHDKPQQRRKRDDTLAFIDRSYRQSQHRTPLINR